MGCCCGGVFLALRVYFVEEGFEFYFLLGGHQGAELFAALLADLFFLGVGRGVEGFPLGACVVNDRGYLFLLVRREVYFVGEAGHDFIARFWRGLMAPDSFSPEMRSQAAE